MGQARAAEVIETRSGKRNSANRAERRHNKRQTIMADCADMDGIGIRDKRVAHVADGWEKDVKQGIEELLDGNHLKTQIGVYYQYMNIGKAWFPINNCGYSAEPVRRMAVTTEAGSGTGRFEIKSF